MTFSTTEQHKLTLYRIPALSSLCMESVAADPESVKTRARLSYVAALTEHIHSLILAHSHRLPDACCKIDCLEKYPCLCCWLLWHCRFGSNDELRSMHILCVAVVAILQLPTAKSCRLSNLSPSLSYHFVELQGRSS